jgi:hypothetical protein
VVAGVLYSLIRLLLDVVATSRQEQAKLQAEVLVLRRQAQVLERQINRVQWSPADRMILAALRERLPRTAWAGLLSGSRPCSDGIATWCAGGGRRTIAGRGGADLRLPRTVAS